MNECYPLSLGEVSPGTDFVRMSLPLSPSGLREGVHTGGPFTDGREVWKPLDAYPGPGATYRERTLEDEILQEMSVVSPQLFPKDWRVEERRGRRFLVRPMLLVVPHSYPPEQITRDQMLLVERMVRTMNEHWWWINDHLNIAFGNGHPIVLDLSSAQRASPRAQGIDQPNEGNCFEAWAELVGDPFALVRLRRAARHLVSSIRWIDSEEALGWSNPRRWVYASFQSLLPVEIDQCIVLPAHIEGFDVRFWCVAPGPLVDAVLKAYNLELAWAPLQYRSS